MINFNNDDSISKELRMDNGRLHGVIVPVITPINDQEDIDEAAFRKHIRRLIVAGVHGIFVGGSAGEGPLLVDRQWQRMVEIAFDEVRGEIFLLGGAIDMSARKVREKVETLAGIGYRHFVLTPTFYIAIRTAEEHLRLFGQAREAAGDMEMVAYNIPQCTGSSLAVDTICEMAKRGWIRCCKESSGDWTYVEELIRRGNDAGLTILAGDEQTSNKALLAGAKGIVPVCANYDPWTYLRLCEAGLRGNADEVARQMERVKTLIAALPCSGPCWLAGIKYAMSALGIGSGMPLSPLEPCDAQRMARIDAQMKADRATNLVVQ